MIMAMALAFPLCGYKPIWTQWLHVKSGRQNYYSDTISAPDEVQSIYFFNGFIQNCEYKKEMMALEKRRVMNGCTKSQMC